MKWIVKGMVALLIGVGLWLMAAQPTLACCCVEDNPITGTCAVCVDCGSLPPGDDGTGVSGFSECSGYPSGYTASCMSISEPGACLDTPFRGTCQEYAPSRWAVAGCGCQTNCGCCPPGQIYQCSAPGNTYYVVDDGRFPFCTNYHSDLYTSQSIPNPDFNVNIPRPENPLCYYVRTNAQGNDVYGCYFNVNACQTRTCGCAPICSDSAPSAPTLTSPANEAQLSSTSVSLAWNAPGSWGAACANPQNTYSVYVGTTNPPTTLLASLSSTVTTSNFTGTRGTTYYWYVRALNGALSTNSVVRSFTILDNQIAGAVYLDSDNTCSTTTPWSTGGLTVSLRNTAYSASVNTSGTYVISANPASYSYMDLSGIPDGYTCSTACGEECPTKNSVLSPSTGNNFFLTQSREAWWQAFGASLYAGGSVRSTLPQATYNLIEPGAGGAIGALLRASGSVDTGSGEVSTPGYSTVTRYKGKTMNYDFFAPQMGVTRSSENDWVSNLITKPSNDPEKDFYYIDPTASEASVTTPWQVVDGDSYVVFVNGDLRISSDITVDEGGFLAFIVNGNITISPVVEHVEGLYVSDSTLITESNGTADVQLAFQGSMVAWGGVTLGRDLSASNIDDPAETFTYRPDLLVNMPEKMKVFALRWQEVVPGTFDN